ncbi:uncharacterized protein LOC135371014 isoform X2 [Ornithodoros turicata]|uniref:uncharacterized protein LOC135371014 isoform X2 n=1 Tax=Ornithodoros turicata TaxID=34597 RepID=UPI003139A9BC
MDTCFTEDDEDREPEPDAKTLEFYRIGPPSILRKPGIPPRRLPLPERRVSFSSDVVDPPQRRRPLQRKQKVSLIALCSFAMVTLVGVFWGYIIHGIVHSEGQEEKPHPSVPDKGVLKNQEETLRNFDDSDYSVPNLVFMTAKPHRRRGATLVVVLKKYSPSTALTQLTRAQRPINRRRARRKSKKDSKGERSKVLLVPSVDENNSSALGRPSREGNALSLNVTKAQFDSKVAVDIFGPFAGDTTAFNASGNYSERHLVRSTTARNANASMISANVSTAVLGSHEVTGSPGYGENVTEATPEESPAQLNGTVMATVGNATDVNAGFEDYNDGGNVTSSVSESVETTSRVVLNSSSEYYYD